MKKHLFFAIALVAGVLAFTGCSGNTIDSPVVGTWSIQESEDMYYEITFDGKGNYIYINDYYFYDQETGKLIPTPHEHIVIKGSFTVKGDIITVHNVSQTISMDGGPAEQIEWEPENEQMKFTIEGNKMHLVRRYGTEDAWTQHWTKK